MEHLRTGYRATALVAALLALVSSSGCTAADVQCAVSLPPNVRDALTTGFWDTTGMLLDRYEEVDATAARLPYLQW